MALEGGLQGAVQNVSQNQAFAIMEKNVIAIFFLNIAIIYYFLSPFSCIHLQTNKKYIFIINHISFFFLPLAKIK